MEARDKFLDVMLREEMRKLNTHLPKKRRSLRELLDEDTPTVNAVDGRKIIMKRSEIEELGTVLPEEVRERVRLPLVFLRRTELGPGAYTLLGDSAEEFALSRIVKGYARDFEEFKRNKSDGTLFYKPEVSELMRRYHSLLVIGFGVSQKSD